VLLPRFSLRSGLVQLRELTSKQPVQIDGIVITRS
jgi:hypothetical protein